GASHGANSATNTQKSTRTAPIMPTGDSRISDSRRSHPGAAAPVGFVATSRVVSTAILSGLLGESDARVEVHVAEIADDLRHDVDEYGDQRRRLDYGDVLRQPGLQHHAAKAGIGEDGF